MEQEILKKFEEQGRKLDEISATVRQLKNYFLWALIISVAVIILPLIGLFFIIPQFLSTYSNLGI